MKINFYFLIALTTSFFSTSGTLSAQFVFNGTGNYTNSARWAPSYPGLVYPSAPVSINGTCTVTDNIFFSNNFTVNSGATLIQDTGSGQITLTTGGNCTINGNVVLKVDNSFLKVVSNAQLTINGNISGIGVLGSDYVSVSGTGSFSPGDPASAKGALWVAGTCDLRGKALNIQLFGNGNNDVLNLRSVSRESYLGGTLNVTLENGYVPAIGHSFVIINSSDVIGGTSWQNSTDFTGKSFSTLNLPTLPVNRRWTLAYSANGVVLSVENSGLPVKLSSFVGTVEGNNNLLKWTTSGEMQNSHFDVERSENGKNFTVIGTVAGAGTTSLAQHYSFSDQGFRTELNYYRLRQVDIDGSIDYSSIISIKNLPEPANPRLYPNPVENELFVDLPAKSSDYIISDVNGKVVQIGFWNEKKTLSTVGLSKGIYFLKSGTNILKFVKN